MNRPWDTLKEDRKRLNLETADREGWPFLNLEKRDELKCVSREKEENRAEI